MTKSRTPTVPAPESSEVDEGPVESPTEPQVRVREWVADYADAVGYETANAFVRLHGRDTDTPSNLAAALQAFRARAV